MPNPLDTNGVIGTDNISPIYNANRRWQIWNMDEIYLGDIAANKYVPKINDVVFEIIGTAITRYIVMDISLTTLVPVLHEANKTDYGNFTDEDLLLGVGPGTQSDTYRILIDKSVVPYRLTVDGRLTVAGSMCRWAKIFKGHILSENGVVISRMYDANGNLLSENIPLELVANTLLDNRAIKRISPCYTNADLQDGEVVTAVHYDDAGFVVSKRQLLVENTAYIRSVDASVKYIVSISLKSPFISTTNVRLIQYPINVPLAGLNLIGVVTYSDGQVVELPVDGTKFSIFGFEQYIATIVGQKIQVVLKYALGPNESNYISNIGSERHISEIYDAITTNVDGSYNIKLYGYPVWINAPTSTYRLEWYMYNLDRNIKYNVTPYVVINTAYRAFDPNSYGVVQRLNVSLNIRDANGSYKSYIHAQTIDIILSKQGTERINNWTVGFDPDQDPKYGVGVYTTVRYVSSSRWVVKVNCNSATLSAWLDKVYYNTLPLFDPAVEAAPPAPTHFALIINGIRTEYPISNWNSDIVVNHAVTNNSTTFIQFFIRTNSSDLHLSVAGLPTYSVDSSGNFV